MVLNMYTSAAITVPKIVARGIFICGSITSSAGTVADSKPTKDQNVNVAALVNAEKFDFPLILKSTR